MRASRKAYAVLLTAAIGLLAGAWTAAAQPQPSAEALLPYFEVEARPNGATTLFAVGNALDQPLDATITVYTNWGIAISKSTLTLAPREVRTFDLRTWVAGQTPGRTLPKADIAHLKAALSGQRSPKDQLYYSSAVAPGIFSGFVRISAATLSHTAALWGDYFFLDQAHHVTYANDLVNLDSLVGCPGTCKRHALRFISGTQFDAGTRVVVWTGKAGKPSAAPTPGAFLSQANAMIFDESGALRNSSASQFLPTQTLTLADLGVSQPFGWIDLQTDIEVFVASQYGASTGLSLGVLAYCLPQQTPPPPGTGIHIRKLTNGDDANAAPGPLIRVGDPVLWQYIVENTGSVDLTDVQVTDDQGEQVTCPGTTLDVGGTMTCTAHGIAVACQYTNVGTVRARRPDGVEITDDDTSHYFGDQNPAISIEKRTNGQRATLAPGPTLTAGSAVTWTYLVTNTGDVALTTVSVTDNKGVAVACPKTSLRPGEAMTCTGSGTAIAGLYENVGTVTASSPCGTQVSAQDTSHYTGRTPDPLPSSILVKKYTNGDDADTAPGPQINVGAAVLWEYVVTNTGQTALSNVRVTDSRGVAVSCPKSSLAAGESMRCTGNGTATAGQYENIGTATGNPPTGSPVTSSDPSHYFGVTPPPPQQACIRIKKYTNGQDADTAPGPQINVGDPVLWEYVVTNTGQTALSNVRVTDNRGVVVSCPKSSLAIGEQMRCTGNGTATAGQYENIGTVTGNPPSGSAVTSSDPSHYYGVTPPPPCAKILIKKYTNGQDADTAPGPQINVGDAVLWEYIVTNNGQTALSNVRVTDNRGVVVSCPKSSLAIGEQMRCTGNGTATAGQYENIGTVTAYPPSGPAVTSSDPSHYYGVSAPPPTGNQGCSPGYWKNHCDAWRQTNYRTDQSIQSVFSAASGYSHLSHDALLDALSYHGGSDLDGAAGNLLRAAVAALLNSTHPRVAFPRTAASIVNDVNAALSSRNRDTILNLASSLDSDDNLSCPLN